MYKRITLLFMIIILSSCNQEQQCEDGESLQGEPGQEVCVPLTTSDSEARGFFSNGSLANAHNLLDRGGDVHKLFLGRERPYGTLELVDFIVDISNEMGARFSDFKKLQVGDLSNLNGGSAAPSHVSHQNGLDVDIVYLTKDNNLQGQNYSFWTESFVKDGGLSSNFDLEKNWEMFKYIMSQGIVNRVFIDPTVKKSLCLYSKQMGDFSGNVETHRRLRPLKKYHQNHFHMRLKCPEDDFSCVSQAEVPAGSGC